MATGTFKKYRLKEEFKILFGNLSQSNDYKPQKDLFNDQTMSSRKLYGSKDEMKSHDEILKKLKDFLEAEETKVDYVER